MTQFQVNAIRVTATVAGFPGKTTTELTQIPGCWLNNISEYGVDFWLSHAERQGFVKCKADKDGNLIYYATAKGKREYEKYSQ